MTQTQSEPLSTNGIALAPTPLLPEGFHVGFHVTDEQIVLDFQERARTDGLDVSDVQRNTRGMQVYCRAPGGVLVEFAHQRRTW